MKCSKCGNEIKEGINFCPMCGERIQNVIVNDQPVTVIKENNNTTAETTTPQKQFVNGMENDVVVCLQILFLALGFPIIVSMLESFDLPDAIASILNIISNIGRLAALPLLIYARIKYPKSKFVKVLIVLAIIYVILAILSLFLLFYLFKTLLEGCSDSSLGMIFHLFNMIII